MTIGNRKDDVDRVNTDNFSKWKDNLRLTAVDGWSLIGCDETLLSNQKHFGSLVHTKLDRLRALYAKVCKSHIKVKSSHEINHQKRMSLFHPGLLRRGRRNSKVSLSG